VVSNPEFLREGEAIRDFRFPDRIVVGSNNKKITKKLESLYDPLIKKGAEFFSTNRRGAELIKYASNAFLATKISYINELANLCEKTGVSIEDVSLGIGLDKRIGSRFLRAGPAFGGSCFPKDTRAVTVTGDLFNTDLSIIKSVIKSNEKRRKILTARIEKILLDKIKNKKITFLGVTFKPNTDDMRQSSSLLMISFLLKRKAKINYYDPSGEKKEFSKFNINIKLPGKKNFIINNIKIPLLGHHNIRNATAAAAVASTIGISKKIIKEALKEFKGVQRRFNKIFVFREATFFDDYAHHPTEIKELLKGVRHVYKKEDIVCVFQPHRISRLKDLKKEFSSSFKNANSVILCPIYSAGEKLKLGFNYLNFAKTIIKNSKVNVFLIKNENQLARYVKQNIWGKKIVIGMGAGSISAWMRNLPKLI